MSVSVPFSQSESAVISAGIVSANLLNLEADLATLEKSKVAAIHFDVMDGCFTPAMTVGLPLVKAVKTPLLKDVHLMIVDPLEKVVDYVDAGADMITIHFESCSDVKPTLERLGELKNKNDPTRGLVRGVAINPKTPVEAVYPLLDHLEMVMILAVDPTAKLGGSTEIALAAEKVETLRRKLESLNTKKLICVDGGVKHANIGEFADMNVDLVVSGSALFKSGDIQDSVAAMSRGLSGAE